MASYDPIQQTISILIKRMSGEVMTLECPFDSHLQDLIPLVKLKLEEQNEVIELNRIHLFSFSQDEDEDEKKEERDYVEDMKMYGLIIMDPAPQIPQEIHFPPNTLTGTICSKLAEWVGRRFTSIDESEYRTGRYGQRLRLPHLPRQITTHPQYMPPRILRQLPHIRAICQYARSRLVPHYWNWRLFSLHILYQQWLETLPENNPIQTPSDYARIFVELHIHHFNWGFYGSGHDTFYNGFRR
jgi:hypothetical protein